MTSSDALGGRYVIERQLGAGGMGEVFRASSVGADGFNKPVVIKRIRASEGSTSTDHADFAEMFVAEAKLMTRLAHPNIVQVLDFGRGADGAYFLVLELVDGVDLGQLSRFFRGLGEPFPAALALHVVAQVVRGLGFAHQQGAALGGKIVHRDVSPENVLLSRVGEVKVADFGVALVGEEASAGALVGKPSYMAPEQFATREIDGRADLFSAAVVLFQLLTGELPFAGDTVALRQAAAAQGEVRSVVAMRNDLPPSFDAFFASALAADPTVRFPDARTMVRAIDALGREIGGAANQDDVADGIARAAPPGPEPVRRKIVLGGAAPAAQETSVTRVERGGGGGAFTVSIEVDPDEVRADGDPGRKTLRIDAPSSVTSRSRLVAMVVLVAAGGGAAMMYLSRRGNSQEVTTSRAAPTGAAGSASAVSLDSASASALPVAEMHSAAPSDATPSDVPRTSPRPPPREPPPPPSASASPGCTGAVVLKATHAWTVTGGPAVAEAPARVSWKCGTYGLRAVSRLDAADHRSASVTVTQGGTAVVDLR